jgi:hypothetical protein
MQVFKEPELLRCPHCDGLGHHRDNGHIRFGHKVSCADCGAQTDGYNSRIEAIAAWNKRMK